jgi:Family of unknown function (DUF6158)
MGAATTGRCSTFPRLHLYRVELTGMPQAYSAGEEDHMPGVDPEDLAEHDLLRELQHLHTTRHDTFLHGSPDALREHSKRTAQLEEEYLRRHPEREVDPARTRSGARGEDSGT